jgi:O-acetyl-ADP-ribose deacetylase (regulator of RNase III)
MGGGVAYVIKRKGGEIVEAEAVKNAPIHVGEAVCTSGGLLPTRRVIHASTMEYPSEKIGVENVRNAVRAALLCADENELSSIAFPGMGTGVGGLSYDDAAEVMVCEIRSFLAGKPETKIRSIFLVAYSDELYGVFRKWVSRILATK